MENIAKFLYEVGQLKRVKRSGWWCVGIKDPETVAEHSHRAAIIGYLLASLAGADPHKVAGICLFHDVSEARINDCHAVAKRYLNQKEAEQSAFLDQLKLLPDAIADQIRDLDYDPNPTDESSLEHILAKDADLLECLIQALEYKVQGYADTDNFIQGNFNRLNHDVSKELARACIETPSGNWWKEMQ